MMITIALLFGLFTLIGGVIGFVKAGSKASLISGGLSGLLILGFTYGLWQQQAWGFWGLIVMSLLLESMFLRKFLQTKSLMPAGLIVMLSSLTLAGLIVQQFVLKHPL